MKSNTTITYLVTAAVSAVAFWVLALLIVPQDAQAGIAIAFLAPLCAVPAAFVIALWQPFETRAAGGAVAATAGVVIGEFLLSCSTSGLSLLGNLVLTVSLSAWIALGALIAGAIGAGLRFCGKRIARLRESRQVDASEG